MSFLLIFLKTARKIAPREAADLSSARFTPCSPCLELLPGVGDGTLLLLSSRIPFARGGSSCVTLQASFALTLSRARPAHPPRSELFCLRFAEGDWLLPGSERGWGQRCSPRASRGCSRSALPFAGVDAGAAGRRSVIWGTAATLSPPGLHRHVCLRLRRCLRPPGRARQLLQRAACRPPALLRTSLLEQPRRYFKQYAVLFTAFSS